MGLLVSRFGSIWERMRASAAGSAEWISNAKAIEMKEGMITLLVMRVFPGRFFLAGVASPPLSARDTSPGNQVFATK